MKRIFSVCMAGLLIFSLSACSSGGEIAHTSGGQNYITTLTNKQITLFNCAFF
ncbi:MAG: hypothetical protein U0N91_11550 [Oscillospiraceae bacterium]|jgi:hypothetical protein|nr:hypothetical protein [Ruminococcus sp.]